MRFRFFQIVLSVIWLLPISAVAAQDDRIQVLLLTGLGNKADPNHLYHHWDHIFYNDVLATALENVADVTVTDDLNSLSSGNLARYDVLISNSMFLEPSQAQLDALFDFVEQGKGYFSIHAALLSFISDNRYTQMIGGRFIGHDHVKTFQVDTYDAWYGFEATKQKRHVITEGVESFNTLDEIYVVQTNTDEIDVIARAEYHPIMWARTWGDGNVLCMTLGHGLYSVQNPGYQTLLRNGVRWLAGELK